MLTIFTAMCTGLALVAVWAAHAYAVEAQQARNDLRARMVDLEAVDAAQRQLLVRIQRLEGKFHASQRQQPEQVAPPVAPAPLMQPCENYLRAQKEGPRSAAAACECAYCETMRAQRRAQRAALAPRNAEQLARFTQENA